MRLVTFSYRTVLMLCAAGVAVAACSSPKPAAPVAAPGSPGATSTPPTSAPAIAVTDSSKGLTLDLVKQQVEPLFAKDPDCPKGEWVTDLADLDAKYRAATKEFAYYDCHVQDNELIPHRVFQAAYVRFADPPSANTFADEGGLGSVLVADTAVLFIGSGLSTVDVRQALHGVETACVCGHVT